MAGFNHIVVDDEKITIDGKPLWGVTDMTIYIEAGDITSVNITFDAYVHYEGTGKIEYRKGSKSKNLRGARRIKASIWTIHQRLLKDHP